MTTKYLVLRTNIPIDPSFETNGAPRSSTLAGSRDLAIDTFDGHEWDAGELRSDPRNLVVLDAEVVLELLQPKSQKPADVEIETLLQRSGGIQTTKGVMGVKAHTSPYTGQGVAVAILDTGIDDKHPAFFTKEIAKKNFTREGTGDADVKDTVGHGTHCAATVCAANVDNIRVGVAPGISKLCVGKVLGAQGGTLEMLLRGLFWAVLEEKASVVSMSLGYDLPGNAKRMIDKGLDPALAVQAAMRQQSDISKGINTLRSFLESRHPNVVFVAATGNESDRPRVVLDAGLPAAEFFSVGAIRPEGDDRWAVAPFSNGRAQIVAPGVDVLSAAHTGGWAVMSGTSMATPHVAGVAALWTEKLRIAGTLFIPESVRSAIKAHADRECVASRDINAIGVGMVQAPQT